MGRRGAERSGKRLPTYHRTGEVEYLDCIVDYALVATRVITSLSLSLALQSALLEPGGNSVAYVRQSRPAAAR